MADGSRSALERCPRCGTPLHGASLCARCLLALAAEATPDPEAPTQSAPGPPSSTPPEEGLPGRIGPYRPVEVLGAGGMGIVYLAEQDAPLRRKVALKLVKRGMDSREVLARFDTERQALALLDHPGIARVIDAGTAEDGRPYFVMEYVDGLPITQYCDRRELTTRERLELFAEVCDAAQHAHARGIVHRDIKPSNVLVAEQEGRARPKIIDFGVAKATAQRLTEKTAFTSLGVMIGTPGYMSPEQSDVS